MAALWQGRDSIAQSPLFLLLALAVSSCFYDSRWGQQKQAQQRQAARLAPQKLQRPPVHSPLQAQRSLALRVYATPAYEASVVDWRQQFQHQLATRCSPHGQALIPRRQVRGCSHRQRQPL